MQAIAQIPPFQAAAGWVNSVLLPERFGGLPALHLRQPTYSGNSGNSAFSRDTSIFSPVPAGSGIRFLKTSFVLDL